MTSQNQPQMFNKVSASEKRIIFRSLSQRQTKITMKSESHISELRAIKCNDDRILECDRLKLNPVEDDSQLPGINNNENVILNFSLGEDLYFMQTKSSLSESKIYLDMGPDLFVLQRRKSMRLEVPMAYPHQVRLIEHKGKVVFIEGRLLDFGAGGCRIELLQMEPLFSTEDSLVTVIRLNHRVPLTLRAQIRHTLPKASHKNGRQIFGVQFQDLGPIMQNKMISLSMEMQKEFFAKFSE